ncbi:MAG: hypothetical protein J6Y48_14885 [Clostridia bacterium]|nr:hypothetical protein [Clostridia bacterium]
MEKIPDADYIREAEQKGVPPYDEPNYSDVYVTLECADSRLDTVIDLLLEAEDMMVNTDHADEIREIMRKVEDLGCEVRKEIKKIKGGP